MSRSIASLTMLLAAFSLMTIAGAALGDTPESTRIDDASEHACTERGGYPYRQKSDYVLDELDLKPGDVVVDIGAGDGWWAEKMAEAVGPDGVIHAAEVTEQKVDQMKERFTDTPQVRPYVCPLDGTGLDEDTCDLAFLSKTYHHLEGHVDYLKHLLDVVKPNGRLVVIEHTKSLAKGRAADHAWSPGLLTQQAEEAGWTLLRCELMRGTNHFIAIFAPRSLFSVEDTLSRPRARGGDQRQTGAAPSTAP